MVQIFISLLEHDSVLELTGVQSEFVSAFVRESVRDKFSLPLHALCDKCFFFNVFI